jgi:hypothetical protein
VSAIAISSGEAKSETMPRRPVPAYGNEFDYGLGLILDGLEATARG